MAVLSNQPQTSTAGTSIAGTSTAVEQPLSFVSEGHRLAAILHPGWADGETGVLIVVGGPQYRVGSHRQFVQLARSLAAAGIACMRFDVTGMGDSEGPKKNFEQLDEDISAAVKAFMAACPQLRRVVLWGLCDGASAALMYAPQDKRIAALVLVNPWLENDGAKAQATLIDYYAKRLFSRGLWEKLAKGELSLTKSVVGLWATLKAALFTSSPQAQSTDANTGVEGAYVEKTHAEKADVERTDVEKADVEKTGAERQNQAVKSQQLSYQQRMKQAFESYEGAVLLVLSGEDLTAKEFDLQFKAQKWRQRSPSQALVTERLQEADHTFSSKPWKRWCEKRTIDFVQQL